MSPAMLLIDTNVVEIIMITITSLVGICSISASLEGYFLGNMHWYERLLCLAGGLVMIYPGLNTDLIGFACAAVVVVLQVMSRKKVAA